MTVRQDPHADTRNDHSDGILTVEEREGHLEFDFLLADVENTSADSRHQPGHDLGLFADMTTRNQFRVALRPEDLSKIPDLTIVEDRGNPVSASKDPEDVGMLADR